MTLSIDLYWSFRSPYSYLAVAPLVKLARDHDVTIAVRPVYPLAVRDKNFFERTNPLFISYLLQDIVRVAEMNGQSIGFPDPDPIVQDMATRKIAEDQPYIHRLTRLGIEAEARGHGLAFIDAVSRLIWDGRTHGWDQGDHMARAATGAGLDLAAMDQAIAAAPEKYDALIEANQDALREAGHWGVPTMVFKGEPFFGQDRIDVLIWRLRQHGLTAR